MKTAREIIDTFTRPVIARWAGVGVSAVKNAYLANKLPASWFDAMERGSRKKLPREAFSFKAVDAGRPAPLAASAPDTVAGAANLSHTGD